MSTKSQNNMSKQRLWSLSTVYSPDHAYAKYKSIHYLTQDWVLRISEIQYEHFDGAYKVIQFNWDRFMSEFFC